MKEGEGPKMHQMEQSGALHQETIDLYILNILMNVMVQFDPFM